MAKFTIELNGAAERLNDYLEANDYKVKVGHRNNYTVVDLYKISNDRCIMCLNSGLTDKQTLEYIYSMIQGILLTSN